MTVFLFSKYSSELFFRSIGLFKLSKSTLWILRLEAFNLTFDCSIIFDGILHCSIGALSHLTLSTFDLFDFEYLKNLEIVILVIEL